MVDIQLVMLLMVSLALNLILFRAWDKERRKGKNGEVHDD